MTTTTERPVAPPGRDKVLYYVLGLTPPVEHAEWVRRDVAGGTWPVRWGVQFAVGILLGTFMVRALLDLSGGLGPVIVVSIGAGIMQMTVWRDFARRRRLAYYEKRWRKQQTR